MAALTWRNVDAPDFRSSMAGFEQFGRLISNAFSGLSGSLERFDQSRTDAVNNAIAMQIAGIQDADTARTAIPQLLAGVDPRRIKTETLNLARQAPIDLLRRAGLELDNKDKSADLAQQALMNPEELRRIKGQNTGIELTNRQNQVNLDQDITEFGWRTTDRNENRLVDEAIGRIRDLAADPDTARAFISQLPAQIKRRVGDALGQEYRGLLGSVDLGAGPVLGGGPAGAAASTVGSALSAAGLSSPVVAGFLGNFEIEGGYTGAQGDGGTAGGIAQWRGERRDNFVKLIGKDPTKASPEEQARFMLWELDNPGRAGMKPEQAAAIKAAKTPAEAARLIDQFYLRSDGKARDRRVSAAETIAARLPALGANPTDAANLDIGIRAGQDQNPSIFPEYLKLSGNRDTLPTVTARLVAGSFKGASERRVSQEIQKLVDRSNGKLNYAQAGALLERGLDPVSDADARNDSTARSWLDRIDGMSLFPNLGPSTPSKGADNYKLNSDRVDALLNAVTSGEVVDQANKQVQAQRAQAELQAVESQYQAVLAEVQRRELQAATDFRVRPLVQRARERLNQLSAQREIALALARREQDGLITQRPKPVGESVPTPSFSEILSTIVPTIQRNDR